MVNKHVSALPQTNTLQDQGKRPTSKDKRHSIRKRAAMRRGQYACVVLGAGLDASFVDVSAGLIRATPEGLFLYRS